VTDGKYAEDWCDDTLDNTEVLVPVVTWHAVVNDRHSQFEDK